MNDNDDDNDNDNDNNDGESGCSTRFSGECGQKIEGDTNIRETQHILIFNHSLIFKY